MENFEMNESLHSFQKMNLSAYEGEEPYIFISYSHADTLQVYKILQLLDKEKFRFWYDDTMEIGEDFRNELRVRIENCSAFLLFVSDYSMESKYCGMEIITAFKNNKKIYPIYLTDDVQIPAPLKMILENLQHVKGVGTAGEDRYIKRLVEGLPIETMRSLDVEGDTLVKCKDGSVSLSVPAGVRVIGQGAFKNCEKLERLIIGSEVEVLKGEACRGCKSLRTLHLPKNVRKVGESAFRDCISLEAFVAENPELELGERAFENCAMLKDVLLNDNMTEIYGGVFNSCKSLKSIKLPGHLTILGESSFADCVNLQEIDIPESVTKLDDMVFNGCLELKKVDMKGNVTKIGKNAFKDCKSLSSVFIPASVSSIGSGPFRGCGNLAEIVVDSKNKCFKSLDGILFNKNKSTIICYPALREAESYSVPDSVTVIGDWAFCECERLKSIEIPDSVCEIGEGAFYSCTALEQLVLPDSVTRIDDTAFRGCSALKRITIPDSVHEFGWGLFNGCDDVEVICNNGTDAARYCDIKNIKHYPAK